MKLHYLRFGRWPVDERSLNHVEGWREDGVSVYHASRRGGVWVVHVPDHDDGVDEETGVPYQEHDPAESAAWRVLRHRRGEELAFLVAGDEVGLGADDEPLLRNVRELSELQPGEVSGALGRDVGDPGRVCRGCRVCRGERA